MAEENKQPIETEKMEEQETQKKKQVKKTTKKVAEKKEEKAEPEKAEINEDSKSLVEEKNEPESAEPKTQEEKAEEKPVEEKSEKPKPVKEKLVKKEEAVANGLGLHASKKHCMYICSFIKNKTIDSAIADLEKVIKLKIAVPFKGEIPHRKGNMMSGRYPVKASGLFINLLKGLKGNVIQNGLELEKTRIYIASASWARRPMRSNNRQGKRTNVILKAKEIEVTAKKNKENKK